MVHFIQKVRTVGGQANKTPNMLTSGIRNLGKRPRFSVWRMNFQKSPCRSLVLRRGWGILNRNELSCAYPRCPIHITAKTDVFSPTQDSLPLYRWNTVGTRMRVHFSSVSPSRNAELEIYVEIFENPSVRLLTVAFFPGFEIPEVQLLEDLLACPLKIITFWEMNTYFESKIQKRPHG